MSTVQVKDYLLCEQQKQTFLMQVMSLSKGTIHGFLAKDYHVTVRRTPIEVVPADIVLNLGQEPRHGSIYGVDITYHVVTKQHDDFGQISFLYRVKKDVGTSVMSAFNIAAKTLKKNRLDFLMGDGVWEIRSAKGGGKYAGMYKHSTKPEKNPHRFLIRPEKMVPTEFPYVIYHELAHQLNRLYANHPKLMARWVIEFNTSIKLATVPKALSQKLLDNLVGGQTFPSGFVSDLEEEDALAYRQIIRLIKADHAVGIKELDMLFESGDLDEIKALWPIRTLHKKDLAPIVSEYACHSVHELLAESVAFYLMGKRLPKRIMELTERTLSYARIAAKKAE